MAETKSVTSDLTGKPVKTHAKIMVTIGEIVHRIDADESEIAELLGKASKVAKARGRKAPEQTVEQSE